MKRLFLLIPLFCCALAVQAAEYRTPNFTINAADAELARQVGEMAEDCRRRQAREWLGHELPRWYAPCPVTVHTDRPGNGGNTSFKFSRGHVYGWDMIVQGEPERIVKTVVPHEVFHTILASHFRRPVPRWADEGAATYEEEPAEKQRQKRLAAEVVGTDEQIPIRSLLNMQEYPDDGRAVLVLYAQGFYLSEFLIDVKGKAEFIRFLETYFKSGDWDTAFKAHYGFPNQEAAYTAAWQANRPPSRASTDPDAPITPIIMESWHIDFFTQTGCPPCQKFKEQELTRLVKTKNVKVRQIDLDQDQNWERARQDGITGTPAFILYRNEKKIKVIRKPQTAAQLLAWFRPAAVPAPKTVRAAQGVGIGYFGPVGGQRNQNLKNPHTDLNPAQLQTIQREIDARADLKINQAISANMDNLDKVIDSRIDAAVLKIESKLTPEQKALINATDAQKAELAALAQKIEQVEQGKSAFQKTTADQVAALQKADQELEQKAQDANEKAAAIESTVTGNVLANVKENLPTGPVGWATFGVGAVQALLAGGPISLAVYMGSRLLARRKEDEPTPATK